MEGRAPADSTGKRGPSHACPVRPVSEERRISTGSEFFGLPDGARIHANVPSIMSSAIELKGRAKRWLASSPAIYKPVSAAYRALDVLGGVAYLFENRSRIMMGAHPILVSYPGQLSPRWSNLPTGHPGLASVIAENRRGYEQLVEKFSGYREAIERIPLTSAFESPEPSWVNSFFTGIDAFSLYGMLASQSPKRYFEIGSGNSTKLVRRAIRDQALSTTVLSIDPSPQAEIDQLCDVVVRQRLEDTDVALFDQLEAGDILFFDGSHHAFMSSDVVVFWLEIIPRLRPGVIVHVHDIFLPYDYPQEWTERHYSEQYLIAVALMTPARQLDILFPATFVERDATLGPAVASGWGPRAKGGSGSFWLRVSAR
jgi:hypothetical protein